MDYISVKDLAAQLGMDRSNARKYILGLGVTPHKRRVQECGHQLVSALTIDEAEYVISSRYEQGFYDDAPVDTSTGLFYIIQLLPNTFPHSVVFGFSLNTNSRLRDYRDTYCDAKILKVWPSRIHWTETAIASITRAGCVLVNDKRNIFQCDNIDTLLERGDTFFRQLPYPYVDRTCDGPA